jgi:hypothetical protein
MLLSVVILDRYLTVGVHHATRGRVARFGAERIQRAETDMSLHDGVVDVTAPIIFVMSFLLDAMDTGERSGQNGTSRSTALSPGRMDST